MHLEEKYELIEAALDLTGSGDQTIIARERASGRPCLVHMLAGGYGGENDAILRKLGRLAPEHRQRILGAGDHAGTPYIVTDTLPGDLSLRQWVKAVATAAPASSTPQAGPGEFTRFLQHGQPAQSPESAPSPAGEFTRWLEQPSQEAASPAVAPGFADIFDSPIPRPVASPEFPPSALAPPSGATGVFSQPAREGPGEFTQMFAAPKPAASYLPLILSLGALLLLAVGTILFFALSKR